MPALLVAFGDSTTAARDGVRTYSEILEQELPAAGLPLTVENAGVRGNTTVMARERFNRDVLSRQPAFVVIQFGINDSMVDVHRDPPADTPRVAQGTYSANLEFFVEKVKAAGAVAVLMTPNRLRWTPELKGLYGRPPYASDNPDGLNVVLDIYAEIVRQCAAEMDTPLVDINAAYRDRARICTGAEDDLLLDGMHPNSRGHRLVGGRLPVQMTPSGE
jgi:lysophospholipase L1-like esterase